MRKYLALLLSFACALAGATTLNPIQLLNPTGSTSGQTIVSTGSSTAPAWGSIAVGGLSPIAGNTVLANATGSSAAPTAFAMPSCSTSASALNWTTSSGYTCNAAVNAATLGGATFAAPGSIGSTTAGSGAFSTLSASSTVSGTGFSNYLASPPAIGGTAPAAGSFTTLSATGLISPASTVGIKGTTTNDSPAAGGVGENPNNSATGTSLTTGTNANATSVALSAGDWDLECVATFVPAPTTGVSQIVAGVSTTSATFATVNTGATIGLALNFTTGQQQTISTPVWTAKLASAGTGYCVVQATFATSTMTVNGFIRARRAR